MADARRGTYLGVVDKIPHLVARHLRLKGTSKQTRSDASRASLPAQELGITAVELLPPFEFDELEFQRIKSPRNHMARHALPPPASNSRALMRIASAHR